MLVSDIMTRSVRTVNPQTPMCDVVSTMCLYRISGLPVVEDGKLLGFIAEKDVLHHLFPSLEDSMNSMASVDFDALEQHYADVVGLKVEQLMSKGVIGVSPDMPILKATSVMVRNRFRRIPVIEGDTLVGMLSLGDVHKALFKKSISEISNCAVD
jgi:CBS domain-containing protein